MPPLSSSNPEDELNALRKLPANKICINCDVESKFGHQNVTDKFKTFVCSNCKSAHQSFSMRVKSVTMSNWTKEEVDSLKENCGGGNDCGRKKWLGNWDSSKMKKPTTDDKLDYFKEFIKAVYIDKLFYVESDSSSQEKIIVDKARSKQNHDTNVSSERKSANDQLKFKTKEKIQSKAVDLLNLDGTTSSTGSSSSFQSDMSSGSFDPFGMKSFLVNDVLSPPSSQNSHSQENWQPFGINSHKSNDVFEKFSTFACTSNPSSISNFPSNDSFSNFSEIACISNQSSKINTINNTMDPFGSLTQSIESPLIPPVPTNPIFISNGGLSHPISIAMNPMNMNDPVANPMMLSRAKSVGPGMSHFVMKGVQHMQSQPNLSLSNTYTSVGSGSRISNMMSLMDMEKTNSQGNRPNIPMNQSAPCNPGKQSNDPFAKLSCF